MADEAFANNPWSAEHWNLTRQGEYIKKYGVEVAKTKARQVGATLGAMPRKVLPFEVRNFILIKKMGESSGAQGTSSSGPPTS